MEVFDFLIVIVLLVAIHVLYLFESLLADVFIKDVTLFFLMTYLHRSVDLPEQFIDPFFFFLGNIILALLKEFLLRL